MNTSVASSWRRRSDELSRSPFRWTRRGSREASTTSVSNPCRGVRAAKRDTAGVGAEPDQLAVVPSARREALGADVECLEQVRLAGAVRAVKKHDAGLEPELEGCVRAEVAEDDLADDQAGSLNQRAGWA